VAALSALVIASVLGAVALPAQAGTAYRYWSYWNASNSQSDWTYATQGSGTFVPQDGDVEGWRFGIASNKSFITPAQAPDFTDICAGVELPEAGKRVAFVIDFGDVAQAPAGETPPQLRTECVIAADGATGLQMLQSIVDVRLDAGFICGIEGFPARECAPLVDAAIESTDVEVPAPDDTLLLAVDEQTSGIGAPLTTAAVLSLLALASFGLWRRSKRTQHS
jgi:hypothetical protein